MPKRFRKFLVYSKAVNLKKVTIQAYLKYIIKGNVIKLVFRNSINDRNISSISLELTMLFSNCEPLLTNGWHLSNTFKVVNSCSLVCLQHNYLNTEWQINHKK